MITRRENMLRVFQQEVPEWVLVAGHCDPYNQPSRERMDPELDEALGEVRWGGTATVTFSRYLGLDIMDWRGMPVGGTQQNVTAYPNRTIERTRFLVRFCRDLGGDRT